MPMPIQVYLVMDFYIVMYDREVWVQNLLNFLDNISTTYLIIEVSQNFQGINVVTDFSIV